MPCGRFTNGVFEITVTFDYNASTHERLTEWPRTLKKAAELFYHATDGQLRVGRWLLANRSYGLSEAEVVIHNEGEGSYASLGGFGVPGAPFVAPQQIHLAPTAKFRPMTVVHELAHHLLSVMDEYTGATETDDIVTNSVASYTVIPIDNPDRADNALVGLLAGLWMGTLFERREIVSSTETQVVVGEAFSFQTNQADGANVIYQDLSVSCHEGAGPNNDGYLCVMEESDNAGRFDANGVWLPYTGNAPSTDFCSPNNHDLNDFDTLQHVEHGQSCWSRIAAFMAARHGYPLTAPNPPTIVAETDWDAQPETQLSFLAEERRFALVVDRSGSMGQSGKMQNALNSANYWIARLRIEASLGSLDTNLAIVSFNESAQTHLPLTDGASLPVDPNSVLANIAAPSGMTNMRAALNTARGLVAPSSAERAASQAIVLLTDGVHNYPESTVFDPTGISTDPDILALSSAGVRVMSIGFGEGDDAIDMPTLEAIGAATCGSFPLQASSSEAAEILTEQLYELLVTGGLAATGGASIPSSPSSPNDQDPTLPYTKRLPLEKLLDAYSLDIKAILNSRQPRLQTRRDSQRNSRFHITRVYVEKGADRASFTLRHPLKQALWLYLIDPNGKAHPLDDDYTRHGNGETFVFTVIAKPMPGLWRMVAVRPTAGPRVDFHAFSGISHRRLVVDGGASTNNPSGAVVTLGASAMWGDRLSGLRVVAEVITPSGQRKTVHLDDKDSNEPTGSGDYRGYFQPEVDGRYQGMLRIIGPEQASPAQMQHRLNHVHIGAAANKVKALEVKLQASRFVRNVPFSFWSGQRPAVKDKDPRR